MYSVFTNLDFNTNSLSTFVFLVRTLNYKFLSTDNHVFQLRWENEELPFLDFHERLSHVLIRRKPQTFNVESALTSNNIHMIQRGISDHNADYTWYKCVINRLPDRTLMFLLMLIIQVYIIL